MKKVLFGILGLVMVGTLVVCLAAASYAPRIANDVSVGLVKVGGLLPDEARKKLRQWWEIEKREKLSLHSEQVANLPQMTPTELGIALDDEKSIQQVPLDDFWDATKAKVAQAPAQAYKPIFKPVPGNLDELKKFIEQSVSDAKPARVRFDQGAIYRTPEVVGLTLDTNSLNDSVITAIEQKAPVEIVTIQASKHVPDEELEKIREVIFQFTTNFRRSQYNRSSNIRTASSKIDGLVLMPGDQFSFNGTVGKRTVESGFKKAGVYINGKHDVDYGGGICQVSTTLYNAALFSNLKIVKHTNHSLPVPYVPLGRDATVNWGLQDLVIENNMETPIALSASYKPGTLSFTVLGKKDPSISVKVITLNHKSWPQKVQTVEDNKLPLGTSKVIEKGSAGHTIYSYRIVYKDGVEIAREPLGRSYYKDSPRIIAQNKAAAPEAKVEDESEDVAGLDLGHE